MKNFLFDSLFLVNLNVLSWDFYVFFKGTTYGYLYCENGGLEGLSGSCLRTIHGSHCTIRLIF